MQISNLTIFLNTLLAIYTARGVLLVGAGNGRSEFIEWLVKNNVSTATLIEPQDTAFKQLEAYIQNLAPLEHQHWSLLKEVVAEQPGLVDFYYASKTTESGLTSPEELKYIWPNLALLQTETLNATSLNDPRFNLASTHNWLIIDCIAALKVIGQQQNLAHVDVAIIKVLFNAENAADTSSDYNAITAFFNAHGFNEKLSQTGLHPDIGYVVYVRDYQAQFNTLKQTLSNLSAAHEQTLSQSKAEQIQSDAQIEQLQGQLKAITAIHEQALTQYKAEQSLWQEKQQASDEKNKQSTEAIKQQQSEIERLQAQLNALRTLHEQALGQHKAEQASLLDQIQASNTTNKQNAIHIQHQQALIEQLQVKLDAAAASYEQALTQYQSDKESWYDANQKSRAESQQQIELVTQQQSQIQQLQQLLSGLKTTHEKTVSQLKELELKNEASFARENKLQTRCELMCKEIERAEAQLNLIKEMGL